MGWLDSAPQQPAPAKGKPPPPDHRSRLKRLEEAGGDAFLPEITACAHLLGYLMECGPTSPGGMGPVPISFTDIRAWQEVTGTPLTSWEGKTLRRLSLEYLSEKTAAADDPKRAAPWPEGIEGAQRVVSRSLRESMRGLADLKNQ